MTQLKLNKITSLIALVFSLSLFSTAVDASGSYNYNRSAPTTQYNQYGLGKQVFLQKLVCSSCPLRGKKFDQDAAQTLLENISNIKELKSLSAKERRALTAYLKKRYKLS